MTFAPQREINSTSGVRESLLERGFDFGFESWSAARPGDLLGALPVGAQAILGAILTGRSDSSREEVSAVVIGEIPRTISPQDTARGAIPEKINLPVDEELEELLEERRRLEEIITQSPIGTGNLPPIDEDVWGPIIRTPVPVPVEVDDSEFEGEEMAHTWFHSATELALGIWGPQTGAPTAAAPQGAQTMLQTEAWLQGATLGTDNGRPPCKRRRRRRALLTQSDLNVLNQIANLPNNSNVRTALAKAVR